MAGGGKLQWMGCGRRRPCCLQLLSNENKEESLEGNRLEMLPYQFQGLAE